jgi:transposase
MTRPATRTTRRFDGPRDPLGTVDDGVIGGVDTHKELHVAAVCDGLGRVLGTSEFGTDDGGYTALLDWLRSYGPVAGVGIEGCSAWGAGLARYLTAAGVRVVEVDRPNRQVRRRRGKSDTIDAEEAARAVVSGRAKTVPKAQTGAVEAIRQLRIARRGAMRSRTRALNQLAALIDTAPDELRRELRGPTQLQRVRTAARLRPGPLHSLTAATKIALISVGKRIEYLNDEIAGIDGHLTALVTDVAPELVAKRGVGVDTAGALLVAAGDNPDRLRHERSFAALCGASPVQASSGKRHRHRLNRGGDREANSALWRIVIVRMTCDQRTRDYVTRRTAEGLSKPEIIRCLKRYVAREIYTALPTTLVEVRPPAPPTLVVTAA